MIFHTFVLAAAFSTVEASTTSVPSVQHGTESPKDGTGNGPIVSNNDGNTKPSAKYFEKMRFLDAQNKQLVSELEMQNSRLTKRPSIMKQTLGTELSSALILIAGLSKDKANLEIKSHQNADLNKQLEAAKNPSQGDRNMINKLSQQSADLESKVNILRRSIGSLETERQRNKTSNNRLQQEVDKLRIDLNNESLAHLDVKNRRQTLEEEITFMKKVHEQHDPSVRHVSIVVSPLLSLMSDQKVELDKLGVSCIIAAHNHRIELKDLERVSVIFTTPETLQTRSFRKLVMDKSFINRVCTLACDEVHCISEWGEDFRPEYRQVSTIRSILDVPLMALTATSTPKVQADIMTYLLLRDNTEVAAIVPNRPNIFLSMAKCTQNCETEMEWLVNKIKACSMWPKTIIFCRSYSAVYSIWSFLVDHLKMTADNGHLMAEMFHSGTDTDTKERIMYEFKKEDSKIRILVATVAFGMGVSIPDITLVIHWGSASSALSYWQEVGRAGRRGSHALAVGMIYPRSLMPMITEKKMRDVAESGECIRRNILLELVTDTMNKEDIPNSKACFLKECNVCECDMCMCCSVCWAKCECKGRMCYKDRIIRV